MLVASLVTGACATLVSTWLAARDAAEQPDGVVDVLLQLSVMVPSFACLTSAALLSAVASAAVNAERKRYAKWQLLGFTPGQVRRVLLMQLTLLGLGFGLVGLSIAAVLAPVTVMLVGRAITAATGDPTDIRASFSGLVFGGALVATMVVVVVSGLSPARQAARFSVLDALRTPAQPRRGMTIGRWGLAIVLTLVTLALLATTVGNSTDIISLNTIFACISASGAVAAATPMLLPALIGAWPRAIPDRASISWTVARQVAHKSVHTSAVAVTPLMLGITLIGSIFSAAYTERNALVVNGFPVERMDLAADQVAIMLGGPLLLAVVGSAAVVFQDGFERSRSASLLSKLGFRRREIVGIALLESLIYVCTALLMSVLTILLIVGFESIALSVALGPSWPSIALAPIVIVTSLGALVVGLATVAPLLTRKSRE